MTADKVKELLERYRKYLADFWKTKPKQLSDDDYDNPSLTNIVHRNHLHWMCDHALDVLIPAGDVEKAMRWMCYIQGVLACIGGLTIRQLRDHSRSEKA